MKIEIFSEINTLQSVIVHQPGIEHHFIRPSNLNEWLAEKNKLVNNPNYLLFDDIINPSKAKEEHTYLIEVIKKITGEGNCIEFTDLLLDILNNIELRTSLLKECFSFEDNVFEISKNNLSNLLSMNSCKLLHVILTGHDPDTIEKKCYTVGIPTRYFIKI